MWDWLAVRGAARRWLGADARLLEDWLKADGTTDYTTARECWPMLEFLLGKMEKIARRRVRRDAGALRATGVVASAIWRAQQRLVGLRQPAESSQEVRAGFVYAVSNASEIKIGWSEKHPSLGRLNGLQIGSAHDLRVVGAFIGTHKDERETHARFGKYHVRGEWFRDVPQIRTFFARHPKSYMIRKHST